MNSFATAFLLINVVLLLLLPRRWAPLPILVAACYMTLDQGIELGPFSFTVIRMLVAAGVLRLIIRGERWTGKMNSLDWLMVIWAIWALISSVFHNDPSGALIFRLGLVYNTCGVYFLLRVFCQSLENVFFLYRITAILVIPLAAEMVFEKIAVHNLFSALGGVSETPAIREGTIRAQGPFGHSILAGTVGAVSLPLLIGLWPMRRKEAVMGIAACLTIVVASSSSGPIMSALAGIVAMLMWNWRRHMRFLRWLAVFGYIGLDLVMKAPAYYLMARIKPIGSSAGYHRARLIQSGFQHLNEWWLVGTDYTRHWMATGVSWSPDHTDITNYYIKMGVLGGLPLMILFIITLAKGFSYVGHTLKHAHQLTNGFRFSIWALGAALFTHAATCLSVSYFDQSFISLYLTLAAIASIWSATSAPEPTVDT